MSRITRVPKIVKMRIPEWAIPKWWVVAYKIPPPLVKEFDNLVQVAPDTKFNTVVSKYVNQVIADGKMPPADIAPAILNLANDFANNREMTIRTGDYIAIQKHIRGMK